MLVLKRDFYIFHVLLSLFMQERFQGPVVQSPISTNPGLTLNKTYRVNPGLALIGL